MLADLSRAREGFVLASDLHLVYLVTPINVDVEPDWESYYERFVKLSPLDQVKINFLVLVFQPTMLLDLLEFTSCLLSPILCCVHDIPILFWKK